MTFGKSASRQARWEVTLKPTGPPSGIAPRRMLSTFLAVDLLVLVVVSMTPSSVIFFTRTNSRQ